MSLPYQQEFYSAVLKLPYTHLLSLLFLTLCRLFPILALTPFLGAKIAPPMAKIAIGLCLFFILLPFLLTHTDHYLLFNARLFLYAIKEAFIGFVIGFVISIPFLIAQTSGVIIDFQRGSSSLTSNDPTMGTQSSPIGQVYNYISIVIFFMIDGPFRFFNTIANSYAFIAPDQSLSEAFFKQGGRFWQAMIGLTGEMFALSIQLAAPSLAIMLMTDTLLGIANRLAPQVQITFLGMPLKSLVGVGILIPAWYFMLKILGKAAVHWVDVLDKLIPLMS